MRFRFPLFVLLAAPLFAFWLPSVGSAADAVKVLPGGYVDYSVVVPKGAAVVWRFSEPPVQRSTTGLPPGRLIFGGVRGKTYTVTAIVIDFTAQTVTDTDYVFEFLPDTGPVVPPKKPVDPVLPVPAVYYFLVVRADGPASPEFTRIISLPAWADLRAAGHSYKDKSVTEAKALGVVFPVGTVYPCVVTLKVTPAGSVVVRGPVPLPTTADGVTQLPNLKEK